MRDLQSRTEDATRTDPGRRSARTTVRGRGRRVRSLRVAGCGVEQRMPERCGRIVQTEPGTAKGERRIAVRVGLREGAGAGKSCGGG
jgi:hypothetical protein